LYGEQISTSASIARHHARAVRKLRLQVVHIERGVVVQLHVLHDQVLVVGELEPGRHATVVVQGRHQDLVARLEAAPGGARQREVERGHVRAEHDLVRLAAEEARGLRLGGLEDRLHAQACLVGSAEVGAGLAEAAGHRVAHLVGNLGTARSVEEGEVALQGGEALADGRQVAHDPIHRLLPGCMNLINTT
jgi:hypothetical protein